MADETMVFLVRQWDCCECNPPCNCRGEACVLQIYRDEEKAKEIAATYHQGFVQPMKLN